MSRRDKILALAISNTKTSESIITHMNTTSTTPILNSPSPSVDKQATQKKPILTDLNELWSRPFDFKKFPAVFENKNEYCNSFEMVQNLDLSSFNNDVHDDSFPSTRQSLLCYEDLPSSDDDDTPELFENSDDSVKDKDYNPTSPDYDSDLSYDRNETVPVTVTVHADIHNNNYRKTVDKSCIEVNEMKEYNCNPVETDTRDSSYASNGTRHSAIVNAQINEEREGTETSHDTSNYVQTVQSGVNEVMNRQNVIGADDIIEMEKECQITQIQIERTDFAESAGEIDNKETSTDLPLCERGLTQSGFPRKRRRFNEPLSERKRQKKQAADEKLSLKPPCNEKCRKKCTTKFTEDIRKLIHDRYVSLSSESRGLFIKGHVEPRNVKTRTITEKDEKKKNRDVSYCYYLYNNDREKVEVCRPFFLTTLGYHPQNTRHIYTALGKEIDDQKDKRGSYERTETIDKDSIKEHIESFNPLISHYRRMHAPKRLYLPSDLNVTLMHQSFLNKNTDVTVSLETYRKVVKDMNISFAHLGNEECEMCALFKTHQECSEEDCETCFKINGYELHQQRYTDSRMEYQKDRNEASTNQPCLYFSVDLQKVVQLPRMDQFKSAIFCPRIIAFNESFVPLGSSSGANVPYAVLWDETVSGRRQEDIISAYRSFFTHHRDAKHFVLWADNCSAQNKNWALMSFLINIVNSDLVSANSITIKYFEPGHSFMSADHFHHQVETALKKKGKVYDMDDFVDAVKMSNSKKNTVKVMQVTDFFIYHDYSSHHKLKNISPRVYLHDIMSVKAERFNFNMKYKKSHLESDWKELDFLQIKIKKNKCFPNPTATTTPRGINNDRKQNIIKKLVPLMPDTRRRFWMNLPETTQPTNIE